MSELNSIIFFSKYLITFIDNSVTRVDTMWANTRSVIYGIKLYISVVIGKHNTEHYLKLCSFQLLQYDGYKEKYSINTSFTVYI